jgi:hypothetical protein
MRFIGRYSGLKNTTTASKNLPTNIGEIFYSGVLTDIWKHSSYGGATAWEFHPASLL